MNKNQKRVRAILTKKGSDGFNEQVATHGYHNDPHGKFVTRRIAPVGGKTVYKKKSKSFPVVGEPMTLAAQRKMFYNLPG